MNVCNFFSNVSLLNTFHDTLTSVQQDSFILIDDQLVSGSCHLLLPCYLASPLGGMTLHIVWHIGAGIGAHMMCVLLTVLR
jgi:hypothetical protein